MLKVYSSPLWRIALTQIQSQSQTTQTAAKRTENQNKTAPGVTAKELPNVLYNPQDCKQMIT